MVVLAAITCGVSTLQSTLPVTASSAAPRICVVVPHFKDEYWLSVGHGLMEQAKLSQAEVILFASGGYYGPEKQIELLMRCRARQATAILIGAVSANDPALLEAVQATAKQVPVVALVNELNSPFLSGAVGVDWRQMGYVIGHFLRQKFPAEGPPVKASLITGPAKSGWSPLLEIGLQQGLDDSAAKITFVGRSDTGLRQQLAAVEAALKVDKGIQILIGSAPAIEGAMGLAANSDGVFPELVSTYISHSVRRGVQSGTVTAVAFDDPVEQGKLGIKLALASRLGEYSPILVGPEIQLIERETDRANLIPLAPAHLSLRIE